MRFFLQRFLMKNKANLQELLVVYVEDDKTTRNSVDRFLRRKTGWLGLANDYLNKPISIDSLCEAIEKLTKL